jgi:DNA-directed RNA polymerase specialized sigma24 family protein
MTTTETAADHAMLHEAAREQAGLELAELTVSRRRGRRDELVAELARRGGLSYAEIAAELGITLQMVGKIAKAAGVQRRPRA